MNVILQAFGSFFVKRKLHLQCHSMGRARRLRWFFHHPILTALKCQQCEQSTCQISCNQFNWENLQRKFTSTFLLSPVHKIPIWLLKGGYYIFLTFVISFGSSHIQSFERNEYNMPAYLTKDMSWQLLGEPLYHLQEGLNVRLTTASQSSL